MAQELRRNERIRISPIRLIDERGEQLGIVETREAIEKARRVELDLVEVAPSADPPVCRIMDFGKYKYDRKKKERMAKAHRHEMEMKEVRIKTPKIGRHDLEIKVNRARGFLERGDRVQFTLRFRGREMAHQNLGREVLNSVKAILEGVAKVERDFRMEGRRLTMVLAPTATPRPPSRANSPKPSTAEAKKPAPTPAPTAPASETSASQPPKPAPAPTPTAPASEAPASETPGSQPPKPAPAPADAAPEAKKPAPETSGSQ